MLDKLRRSKANYLHRKILEYQRLLARVVNLAGEDGLLILDDLYYIRRSDQPLIIDYFHRLTKNQRMWLKVGTIRHRSTWFVRGDPAVGTKLGDDADAIDLDITLERYNIAKAFLTKILARSQSPRESSPTSCLRRARLTGSFSRAVGSHETSSPSPIGRSWSRESEARPIAGRKSTPKT
jgi:hypothetical protein